MKSLYRRYRPMQLCDVVGQPQVIDPLSNALKSNKISHAYLFIGPRGTGKTSVARIFAHEVNGFKYELEDDYVDIIEIDGASNRGIDNIRELREKVAIAPTSGKYKIYIIDEVHMLTKEAFNALLKTLEEPPAHVIFILATTDAYKVPVTITSRAQTFTFRLADKNLMLGYLKTITEKEKIRISEDALKIIVERGGGSFRDTLSLLDQISTLSSDEITRELVISAMGLPEDAQIEELLKNYLLHDNEAIKEGLKRLFSAGVKPEVIVEQMITRIIDNPSDDYMELLSVLPDVKSPFAEAKLLVALIMKHEKQISANPSTTISTATIKKTTVEAANKQKITTTDEATIVKTNTVNDFKETINTTVELSTDAVTEPVPQKASPSDFSWDSYLETVRGLNDAIYSQLKTVKYALNGTTLDIFPTRRIAKTILGRDNNKKILIDAADGLKVVIHEVGEGNELKNDALVSKISDIMGGEVQNDGGGNPF